MVLNIEHRDDLVQHSSLGLALVLNGLKGLDFDWIAALTRVVEVVVLGLGLNDGCLVIVGVFFGILLGYYMVGLLAGIVQLAQGLL